MPITLSGVIAVSMGVDETGFGDWAGTMQALTNKTSVHSTPLLKSLFMYFLLRYQLIPLKISSFSRSKGKHHKLWILWQEILESLIWW
jgi:hypothetical protein